MKDVVAKTKVVVLLLFSLYFLLQLPFLTRVTGVMVDEPWYASIAYNFLKTYRMVDAVRQDFWVSLHPLLMSAFFKTFGTSLLTGRLFSVIGGLIGLFGFIKILQILKIKNVIVLFSGLVYIFSNVNYIIFRTVRPEGWVVAFIIWGLYFLIKAIDSARGLDYFLSGLFVSLSFLCHPNGAMFVFLFGIVTLVYSIKTRESILFTGYFLGCLVIFVVLLSYIIIFKEQNPISFFRNWLGRTSVTADSIAVAIFRNLTDFIKIYTLGVKRLFIFIFEIGILIFAIFHFKRNKNFAIMSFLGLSYFALSIIFLKPFAARHFTEVLIFSSICLALTLQHYEKKGKIYKFFLILAAMYFLNNLLGDVYVIKRDHNKVSYSYIEKTIDNIVPDDATVLTLMHFWFPLKNNDTYYGTYTRWAKTEYGNIDEFLSSGDVDYVVISDFLCTGTTATSGRKLDQKEFEKHEVFFIKARSFASANGNIVEVIETNNYGDIEIWKTR